MQEGSETFPGGTATWGPGDGTTHRETLRLADASASDDSASSSPSSSRLSATNMANAGAATLLYDKPYVEIVAQAKQSVTLGAMVAPVLRYIGLFILIAALLCFFVFLVIRIKRAADKMRNH